MPSSPTLASDVDVLVVGAGPTGLTLASQLARFGVRFRIIDKARDRAGESRALAVQARSLEVLQTLGLGETLVSRGRTTTRLLLHVDRGEPPAIELGNIGRDDTRFPFVLFVSQPETEAVLTAHLERAASSSSDPSSSKRFTNSVPAWPARCGMLTVGMT